MNTVDSVPVESIESSYPLDSVESALEDLRHGKLIILIDREDRENEGDLVCAAQFCTPEHVNFMATQGRGLICVPLLKKRLQELDLRQMVEQNTEYHGTAFAISCDLLAGNSTGISAHDRSRTIQALVDPKSKAVDFCRPGHIFPLQAKDGGVLIRSGQTEGSVDLCRLAGLYPGAVICEIMKDDGTMARMDDLLKIAHQHQLKVISVPQIIEYRSRTEKLIQRIAENPISTPFGIFNLIQYESLDSKQKLLTLVYGQLNPSNPVLMRVQKESLLDDIFLAKYGQKVSSMVASMEKIQQAGQGVLIYICAQDRSKDLARELLVLESQENDALDTSLFSPNSDLRTLGLGAQVIKDLGITEIRLLTNHTQRKIIGLQGFGIEIVQRVPVFDEFPSF